MANPFTGPTPQGTTRLGADRPGVRGSLHIRTGGKTGTPGCPALLMLDSCDTNGVIKTWGLWVDSTGKLRIVEVGPVDVPTLADPFVTPIPDESSSGTVVGSQ